LNKPLTEEILLDSDHLVTQTLIYIHSMETFIYKDMKKASLQKDITKVKTLGPYAFVISKILEKSMYKKLVNDNELFEKYRDKPLFRGILIDKEMYNE
jgi:hypothetical protein